MFTERKDVAGVPSTRTGRACKVFEAQLDAALGERIRADGASACDLWSALADVAWYGPAGEDGAGIALALRWSSPTTALRYARELAVGSNAAARVLGKLRQEVS